MAQALRAADNCSTLTAVSSRLLLSEPVQILQDLEANKRFGESVSVFRAGHLVSDSGWFVLLDTHNPLGKLQPAET